jgi:hypothetical protein
MNYHINYASCSFASFSRLAFGLLAMLTIAGCRQGPAAIRPPDIDAYQAGELAMKEYDTDGNGAVDGDELERAPSLKAALATLDQDSDGRVTADEVAARVGAWQEFRKGLTSIMCRVLIDGRPLAGAQVTFEPESFLGDEMRTAVGETNRFGMVSPIIPKEERPTPDTPPGLPFGLYKVRISKVVGGSEQIPARYNVETVLAQQVSFDDQAMLNNRVRFELSSK